jgi:aldoxime dehydratase
MGKCPNMPANWSPPAPAWRCQIGPAGGLVVAHFGSQATRPGPTALDAWVNTSCAATDGPAHVDRAVFVDRLGKQGRVSLCYWRDAAAYQRWAAATDAWWVDEMRLREPVGYWREVYTISSDRFETIWSSPDPHAVGIRHLTDVEGPMLEHAYWGAARDRLEVSIDNPLLSPLGNQVVLSTEPTDGRRIRIRPPENLCVIRSGQDWSGCNDREFHSYLSDVEPSLRAGMSFLLTHPQETGCIPCADSVRPRLLQHDGFREFRSSGSFHLHGADLAW